MMYRLQIKVRVNQMLSDCISQSDSISGCRNGKSDAHTLALMVLQVEGCSVSMEDSSEQSHWMPPALLASDPLAGFSSETSLLPQGEEGEAFFAGHDADLASLPSFFSSPSHSRATPTYRASSGQCSLQLSQIRLPLHPLICDLTSSCCSVKSPSGLKPTRPPQQPPAAGRAGQPLPELAIQLLDFHLEQRTFRQAPPALTRPNLPLHLLLR